MPAKYNEFRSGDRVVLESGGPTLTVRVVSGDHAYCEWLVGTERRHGTFALVSLVPADPDDEPSHPAGLAK